MATPVQSGRIPESFIESVLAKTDLVVLIQESVKLKKSGANYSACCPFHQEKTPSFTVSAVKQFYHCFGCGAHGDAIRFLMEYEHLHFVEAIEKLALRAGLSVPRTVEDEVKIKNRLEMTTLLNQAAHFYAEQLKHHPEGKEAIEYLKKRGLTGKTAKQFELGYAPSGWDNVISHFHHRAEAISLLEQTGLIIQHESKRYYDRFRHRILFPIRDPKGQVIGFGGRVLDNSQPKYLNSPETPVFQKSYCLYGIYEILKSRQKWERAIVVEGYFDVVMLAQHGVFGSVATLGTAITPYHLQQLFQRVNEVVFCFDGDPAGQAAAWKALQLVLPLLTEGRQARFAFLPSNEDPDSYVRRVGKENFLALLHAGASTADFLFSHLVQETPPDSIDNRAKIATMAKSLIEQIPASIFREMMFEQLATLVSSSPQVVRGEKAWRKKGYDPQPKKRMKSTLPPPKVNSLVMLSIAILLRQPELAGRIAEISSEWEGKEGEEAYVLRAVLTLLQEAGDLTSADLQEWLTGQVLDRSALNDCIRKVALIPEGGLEAELTGALRQISAIGQEEFTAQLLQKAKTSHLSADEKRRLREMLSLKGNQ
jgi:DNA primase